MSRYDGLAPEILIALAFGSPLRDGLELVREKGLGALVVLGCDGCHPGLIGEHDDADEPLTSEGILRAARNDGATVLGSDWTSVVMKHAGLFPSATWPAAGRGLRHLTAEKFAEQTGHPVIAVSAARSGATTVFVRGRSYSLPRRDELRTGIDDAMNALRAAGAVRETGNNDQAIAQRTVYMRALLADMTEMLVELGPSGVALQQECEALTALLGLDWTSPGHPWPKVGEPGPAGDTDRERRLRALSNRLAAALDMAGSRALDGDHRLGAGLYVQRTRQRSIVDMLRTGNYDKPVLVHGVPGEGKSSLLWGLYDELRPDEVLVPYLINSLWLLEDLNTPALVPAQDLQHTAMRARAKSQVAVFLIDTVDLLLHDEVHRQKLMDLCELLGESDGRVVLTSRTEESHTLPPAMFRSVGLGPYDNDEFPVAIEKHAAAFCPGFSRGDLEEQVARVIDSAARGLPLREVVLNPLNLRLLFELYHPYFPADEHDVSSLYSMYWDRRVRADQRDENSSTAGADLRMTAENVGIALLASGRTELDEHVLERSAGRVAENRFGRHVDAHRRVTDEIAGLARRGVLVRSEDAIRFFHQTMFEYAAALGLLGRDQEASLSFLASHLESHPDDLFVGAVAEQALVLALDDPLIAPAATAVLTRMASTGAAALQRIALGVLAHKPTLHDTISDLIDVVDEAALRRYVLTVPTVLKADVAHQVEMLARAWRRTESVRESVLVALERFAARNPAVVLAVLRDLDCVGTALAWQGSSARMVKLAARTLVATAAADPQWAGDQMLRLLSATLEQSTSRTLPAHLIDVIADNWTVFGSSGMASDISARVVSAQNAHDAGRGEMRQALGRVLALAWRDELADEDEAEMLWSGFVCGLIERLVEDHHDFRANAQLQAVAYLVEWDVLDPSRSVGTLTELLAMPGAGPFALSNSLLAEVFRDGATESAAVAAVTASALELLDGLPAPGNGPAEGAPRLAHVVRQALHHAKLDPPRLATLLSDAPAAQEVAHWLDDAYLAVLLVPAALGGHVVAQQALDVVWSDMTRLSENGRKNLGYEVVRRVHTHPELLPLLIEQSVLRASAAPFSEVVTELDEKGLVVLRAHSSRLTDLVDVLFQGGGALQRDAASLWRRLHEVRAVPTPDHELLVHRFRSSPAQAARGNILELAVDIAIADPARLDVADEWLRGLFLVDGSGAVVSPRTGKPHHVAGIAREAWLRLTCQGRSAGEVDRKTVLAVAGASPTTSDNLSVLGYLMARLSQQGDAGLAASILTEVAAIAERAELRSKQENRLANKLRTPIRTVVRSAPLGLQRELLARVPELPQTLARMVVAAAAQENFTTLRPDLAALLEREVPDGVVQQIHDDIRIRSRTFAVGPLPRLIEPLRG